MSPDLDTTIQSGANEAFAELDLVDLNVILHRADGEEKDATGMFTPYLLLPLFHKVRAVTYGTHLLLRPSFRSLARSPASNTNLQAVTESTRSQTTDL